MKRKLLAFIILTLAGLGNFTLVTPVQAAPPKEVSISKIPANLRSWAGIPWLIGGAFVVGAVLVGIKNAKRTHLD